MYAAWLERHKGTDRVTGSRTADMRSALVDYFREQGRIMIATEAGAEGINLQFCSLVVNYDLPWNPQRIEQRIGRCHRYGQKHDVVVLNFLNQKNEADQRVYTLLSEKFKLFEGVFGASDEVLGAIESGVEFEKRVAAIYQGCRKSEDIRTGFDKLQLELNFEINESFARTRQRLIENFDDEVRDKLKVRKDDSEACLNRFERMLMRLTQYELKDQAQFLNEASFKLLNNPFADLVSEIPLGIYELPRRSNEAHYYRLNHALAQNILNRAKARALPVAEIHFSYEEHQGRVSPLKPFIGKAGWLSLSLLTLESLDSAEDRLICEAIADDGTVLESDIAQRLLSIPGIVACSAIATPAPQPLIALVEQSKNALLKSVTERNIGIFEAETDKLENWAEDLKLGLEHEIKELDRQIREARRTSIAAPTLDEKIAAQKQIKSLEGQRNQKRKVLFDAQDEIDARRGTMIADLEGKCRVSENMKPLFQIRWRLI
jgi:adenine-specific DNA-methyltransferase